MGRPLDWLREHANVGSLTLPSHAPAAAPDDLRQLEREAERRRVLRRLEDEEEAERDMRRDERETRRLELQAQREALVNRAARGDAGASGDVTKLFRDLLEQSNRDKDAMLSELRDMRKQFVEQGQQQAIKDLQSKLEALSLKPAGASGDVLSDFQRLTEAASGFRAAREALESVYPSQSSTDLLDRRTALEQERIREEAAIRRLDAEGRLEEARAAREQLRADGEAKSERTNRLVETLQTTLGPALGALMGSRVAGAVSGAAGAGEAAASPAASGLTAPAQGPEALSSPAPELLPWHCEACGFTNHAPLSAAGHLQECARCRQVVRLGQPQQEQPPTASNGHAAP